MRAKRDIETITIEGIAQKYGLPNIGNDIVLMPTLHSLQKIIEAKRMSLCLFIGVCTSGVVTLTVNDRKRAATADNVMIITDESVIDNLLFSDDFDGMGVFVCIRTARGQRSLRISHRSPGCREWFITPS